MKQRILSIFLVLFLLLSPGVTALAGTVYTVHSTIPVYNDSLSASQRINSLGTYEPGTYYLYKNVNGMHNISRTDGIPGGWINPAENRAVIGTWETKADVNFRTGPSSAYPVISKLLQGTQVELVEKTTSTWYEVRYNGTTGYISTSYLSEVTASDPTVAPVFLETISNVNFRTGPASTYSLIQYLLAGTKVELVSRYTATWYEIRYAGRIGYISARYLKDYVEVVPPVLTEDPAEPINEVIKYPYVATSAVNFRTGPSTAYPVIKKFEIGQTMSYLAPVRDGWVQVLHAGNRGYVSSNYITPLVLQAPSADSVTVTADTKTHVVNALADVRTGPGTDYTKLTRLSPGAMVGVISMNNSWAKIRYLVSTTLKTGYVNTSFISPQALTQGGIPKIGIAWNPNNLSYYIEAIKRAGGEAVLLPEVTSPEHAAEIAATVSGIVFAGGRSTSASDRFLVQEAIAQDKPTVGVCLGFQLINAASGGTLKDLVGSNFIRSQIHRDPTINAYFYHDITILPDTKLASLVGTGKDNVNSFHRYIVNTVGSNLKVMAQSPDGVVEGIERTDKTFIIGLASHPERMYDDGNTIYHSIFVELVKYARSAQ